VTPPEPSPPKRAPYHKPKVERVPLRPEEAVLGACKTGGISGPGDPTACSTFGCYNLGS
jgi:hypothetical protein